MASSLSPGDDVPAAGVVLGGVLSPARTGNNRSSRCHAIIHHYEHITVTVTAEDGLAATILYPVVVIVVVVIVVGRRRRRDGGGGGGCDVRGCCAGGGLRAVQREVVMSLLEGGNFN